jgi:hypothetical protein
MAQLSDEQRRALRILARSPNGSTEVLVMAHGFEPRGRFATWARRRKLRAIVNGFGPCPPGWVLGVGLGPTTSPRLGPSMDSA